MNSIPNSSPGFKLLAMIKIGQLEHLEMLRAGMIRCRSLSFYKSEEQSGSAHYDNNEGVSSIALSKDSDFKLTLSSGEESKKQEYTLTQENGLHSVMISEEFPNAAFCLHAIHTGDWFGREINREQLNEFIEEILIFKNMHKYGSHVLVLKNIDIFLDRIKSHAISNNYALSANYIKYIDFSKESFHVPEAKAGLIKDISFKNEREYRILFKDHNYPDPFIFDIGDLSEISEILSMEEFLNRLRLKIQTNIKF